MHTLIVSPFVIVAYAGFPSPAADFEESPLNLHDYVVKNAPATFFVRVKGDSMKGASIFSGDLLVVDRSITPGNGHIIIACLNGGMIIKRLKLKHGGVYLVSDNSSYRPIKVSEDHDFKVWGVVTYCIHQVTKERVSLL